MEKAGTFIQQITLDSLDLMKFAKYSSCNNMLMLVLMYRCLGGGEKGKVASWLVGMGTFCSLHFNYSS